MNTEVNLYAAYDTKAKLFLPIFGSTNNDTAAREFVAALIKEGTPVSDHPTDYNLFGLGTFHTVSGKLEPMEGGAVCILTGLEAMALARPRPEHDKAQMSLVEDPAAGESPSQTG